MNTTVEVVKQCQCSKFKELAKSAVEDIKKRAGKQGQFLNWIEVLANIQLQNLDNLYDMAISAKGDKYTDLAILGIGGSRHTTESMVNMLGCEDNIHFYSALDETSFNKFTKTLDLDKTKFMVVSKSGGTLETTVAYESAKKLVQEWNKKRKQHLQSQEAIQAGEPEFRRTSKR